MPIDSVPVARTRLILFGVTALLTATIVSMVGAIGFVGLVVPHAARYVVGQMHLRLLPACAAVGAAFMVLADIVSRLRLLGGMTMQASLIDLVRPVLTSRPARWLALLGLCAAYLQGSLTKLFDFNAAIAEMTHFGLNPAPLFAAAVIGFELAASAMILSGFYRWLGALGLAGFTLLATFVALRFWEMPDGMDRMMATNAFFEHLGLIGGFILVAMMDVTANEPSAHNSRKLS